MKPSFSEEQKAEIVRRYVAGEGSSKLAKEFGCESTTILGWVRKAGHRTRNQAEAAALRDRSTETPPRHEPSPEEIAEVAAKLRLKHFADMRALVGANQTYQPGVRSYRHRRVQGIRMFVPD